MTAQLCTAPHRDNAPGALGGLLLCAGHHGALTDALTGPSAADDPTIDAVWGVHVGWGVVNFGSRDAAYASGCAQVGGSVVCNGGTGWTDPRNYRPGGLTRDWLALERRGSTQATGEQAPYVSHSTDNPLPIDSRMAQLRNDIPAVLRGWASVHVEEFHATRPAGDSVAQLVTFLAVYRDAAAGCDWAGDYVSELAALRARARRLIDLPGPARAAVGPCPERTDGQPCTGTLYSDIREERDPRPSEVRCDTCGTGWDSTQWMRLGQRVAMAARRMAA